MIEALDDIEVITLFVSDLDASKDFYSRIFKGETVYEDKVSWVLKLNTLMINLLLHTEAKELIEPKELYEESATSRLLLTIKVKDTNQVCEALQKHAVPLLNGPIDRPWGRRTAAFSDPDGNVWEVAQELD